MVLHYERCSVEEVFLFSNENEFKSHLLKLLNEVTEEVNVNENISLEELIKLIDKTFNYDDGDFWRIPMKIKNNKAYKMK